MQIGIAILVLGGLGILFAVLLGVAAQVFRVEEDPRVGEVLAVLPGANCGACGLAGCRDYSERVVLGLAGPGACTAGGAKVAEAIAAILGVEATAQAAQVATIHCGAKAAQRLRKGHYTGIDTCLAVSLVDGGGLACAYGCLGSGDCRSACPFGAIRMEEGLPVVDADLCTGCGQCVTACPRKIISLRPAAFPLVIACSSRDPGPLVRKVCPVGCIGCKMCVRQVPELFSVTEHLAAIDETKSGIDAQAAVEKCPTHCIVSP